MFWIIFMFTILNFFLLFFHFFIIYYNCLATLKTFIIFFFLIRFLAVFLFPMLSGESIFDPPRLIFFRSFYWSKLTHLFIKSIVFVDIFNPVWYLEKINWKNCFIISSSLSLMVTCYNLCYRLLNAFNTLFEYL